jgi:hypothetical protein
LLLALLRLDSNHEARCSAAVVMGRSGDMIEPAVVV